jgi:hypothetical protein
MAEQSIKHINGKVIDSEPNNTLYGNISRLTGVVGEVYDIENMLADVVDNLNFRVLPRDEHALSLNIADIEDENINAIFNKLVTSIENKLVGIKDTINNIKSYIK